MVYGLSCSAACGIFPIQGLNSSVLRWQVDSFPSSHQRGPIYLFIHSFMTAPHSMWDLSFLNKHQTSTPSSRSTQILIHCTAKDVQAAQSLNHWATSVQSLCLTSCNPMDCSTPGSSVLHCPLELAQTHVH